MSNTLDTQATDTVTLAETETLQPSRKDELLAKYADDPGVRSVFECGVWTRPEVQAACFAAVLEDLDNMGWSTSDCFDDMPSDYFENEAYWNVADEYLGTDIWARRDDAQALAHALRDFCHSGAAGRIFGEATPSVMLRNPRIGFAPVARFPRVEPNDSPGYDRRLCELTGEAFDVPTGAPVPALFYDAYHFDGEAIAEVNADEKHPGDRNPEARVIHPALIMAGPAFVMWAVCSRIRDLLTLEQIKNHNVGERLREAVELLTIVAGAGPDHIGVENPASAYIAWQKPGDVWTRIPDGWVGIRRHEL